VADRLTPSEPAGSTQAAVPPALRSEVREETRIKRFFDGFREFSMEFFIESLPDFFFTILQAALEILTSW
jgi:hypothetical protein